MMRADRGKTVLFLLIVLVLGACAALSLMRLWNTSDTGQKVIVEQDGVVVYEGPFKDRNGAPVHPEGERLNFTGSAGEYSVAFEDGKVCMVSSNCPDKLCVHQGWTDNSATPIICLPQRIVISIESIKETETGPNLISETRHQFLLDTTITMTVYAPSKNEAQRALTAAFLQYERIEGIATRYEGNSSEPSDIQRINKAAGETPQVADAAILTMLKRALSLSALGEGTFNPGVGPLVDLWGIGAERERVPSVAEVQAVLPLLDMTKIHINEEENTVFLSEKGMSLDLGGVAKGYATDMAAQALRDHGIEHAFINAGGNVYVLGGRPDGSPWRIGIQDPRRDGEVLGVVELVEGAVVSSGDYQRYFMADGVRYHHIFDPRDGWPAQGVWQTTIIATNSMDADILSTIAFVLTPAKGEALLKQLGLSGVTVDKEAGIAIYSNGETRIFLEDKEGYHIK